MRARPLYLLAVFGTCLAAAPARAQSLHAETATLRVDGEEVGWLTGAVIEARAWPTRHSIDAHYEDDVIALDARVDLDEPETVVVAGVGQPVTLEAVRAFRVEMLPGTFARVVRRDAAGRVRIRLPDSLPQRVAAIPVGAPPSQVRPARHLDEPEEEEWEHVCGPLEVLAERRRDAPVWAIRRPTETVLARVGPPDRRGYRAAEIWIAGYVVHGFLKRALPWGGCGFRWGGSSCYGRGSGPSVRVELPAGTPLFGSETASAPFAQLRAPVEASLRSGRAIPSTSVAWSLTHDAPDGARWSLTAWLRMTPEALRALQR